MHQIISGLLNFISAHSYLSYGAVFLISLSESLAIIGLVIPGTVIMFGIGAVITTGSLSLLPVLAFAAAGAIAGDGISYWLGRRYRDTTSGFRAYVQSQITSLSLPLKLLLCQR